MPQWTYHTLFVSNHSMFSTIDKMCLEFVLTAEGMECNSDDANKSHNVLHVAAPLRKGGLGLHQMFWSHCARLVTMMQSKVRAQHSSLVHDVNNVLLSHATPIHNYLSILIQLGARAALHFALSERPAGGPELIDSKSSDNGAVLQACTPQVGDPQHTRHYVAPIRCAEDPSTGRIPLG